MLFGEFISIKNLFMSILFKKNLMVQMLVSLCLSLISCSSVTKEVKSLVIEKTVSLSGDKEQVWSALTDEVELSQWWGKKVRLDPKVNGEFYEPWGDGQLATGVVLSVTPQKTIKFTWREKTWSSGQQTVCEFSIEKSSSGTLLKIKHSGWEIFGDSKNQMVEGFNRGWDFIPVSYTHLTLPTKRIV